MTYEVLRDKVKELSDHLNEALAKVNDLGQYLMQQTNESGFAVENISPFMIGITVFVLAVFVGYYVVWKVTPALHSPLMSVTNAISSVIIIGALIAAGQTLNILAQIAGFIAIILASINIFGGFVVTRRMLEMFDNKKKGTNK